MCEGRRKGGGGSRVLRDKEREGEGSSYGVVRIEFPRILGETATPAQKVWLGERRQPNRTDRTVLANNHPSLSPHLENPLPMAPLQSLYRPLSLAARSVARTTTSTLPLPLAPKRCFSQFAPLCAHVGQAMSMPRTKIKSEASQRSHRDISKLETEDLGLFPCIFHPPLPPFLPKQVLN